MRIIIVNDQHWPMKSGCAQASRTQALGLAARGHEVLVIAPSLTSRNGTDQDTNYDIVRIRSFKFRNNLRVSVVLDREVRRVLRDFQPDIVHVHTQLTLGLAVLRAATNMGIPVVATNHVMPDNIVDNVKVLGKLSKPIGYIWTEYGNLLYKGAKRIIMPTESALQLFNLERIEAPTLAISNGINLEQFKPSKAPEAIYKKFKIPQDKHIIAYIGRLDKDKHINTVVEAFAELTRFGRRDIHLLLAGTGNDVDDLTDLVSKLGLEKTTTFTGPFSEEDWPFIFKIPTVYCMPSPVELQSLATLESMASGKPVVAIDAGALSELCHNDENGYLVYPDDVKGFARAITMLLDNPKRLKEFGKKSRKIAETHDEKMVMPQFEEVYRKVIAETKREPKRSRRAFRSVLGGRRQR